MIFYCWFNSNVHDGRDDDDDDVHDVLHHEMVVHDETAVHEMENHDALVHGMEAHETVDRGVEIHDGVEVHNAGHYGPKNEENGGVKVVVVAHRSSEVDLLVVVGSLG